jgi:hypothetical protein
MRLRVEAGRLRVEAGRLRVEAGRGHGGPGRPIDLALAGLQPRAGRDAVVERGRERTEKAMGKGQRKKAGGRSVAVLAAAREILPADVDSTTSHLHAWPTEGLRTRSGAPRRAPGKALTSRHGGRRCFTCAPMACPGPSAPARQGPARVLQGPGELAVGASSSRGRAGPFASWPVSQWRPRCWGQWRTWAPRLLPRARSALPACRCPRPRPVRSPPGRSRS